MITRACYKHPGSNWDTNYTLHMAQKPDFSLLFFFAFLSLSCIQTGGFH